MTVLRLVGNDNHSRKAPTDETLADLEWITRNVLAVADLAVTELRHAIINRDLPAALIACRNVSRAGVRAGDYKRERQ